MTGRATVPRPSPASATNCAYTWRRWVLPLLATLSPVVATRRGDYSNPLQLLAQSLEFTDPLTGERRHFEKGARSLRSRWAERSGINGGSGLVRDFQ